MSYRANAIKHNRKGEFENHALNVFQVDKRLTSIPTSSTYYISLITSLFEIFMVTLIKFITQSRQMCTACKIYHCLFLGRTERFTVHWEEIYLYSSQVLLLLQRRLMNKPQPVGIAWVTCIQNIQHISFTASDLEYKKKQLHELEVNMDSCSFAAFMVCLM